MRALLPLLLLPLAIAARPAKRSPRHHAPPPPPPRRSAPLPSLPVVTRVRVEASRGHVLIEQELTLARGEWRSGEMDLFVAFGAPGLPRAFDAHLLAVPDGALTPALDDAGEPVITERAARKPSGAVLLLGQPNMAGEVVRVSEPAFRRAVGPSALAALRLRTVLAPPAADAQGGHEVVVRLGISGSAPLSVWRVDVASAEADGWLLRASGHYCGPEADPYPLAVAGPAAAPTYPLPAEPLLVARHASDDLCVSYWTRP